MKTKEEILKMNAEELINYKWNDNLDKEVNINCRDCRDCIYCINCINSFDLFYCIDCLDCRNCRNCLNSFDSFDCLDCLDCKNCKNCAYCRNIKHKQYCICNVQLTEEEYKKKIKKLKEEQK